jgi:hypothetical protein
VTTQTNVQVEDYRSGAVDGLLSTGAEQTMSQLLSFSGRSEAIG